MLDPLLTPAQRVLAAVYLKRYLESCFPASLPFKLYTFRSTPQTLPVADRSLDGVGSRSRLHPTADRRPVGSVSDPVADAVVRLCDGVEVLRREFIEVPAAQIRQLVEMLPSHLEQVVTLRFLERLKQEVVAARLATSHSTISRRLNEAVAELCSLLYGPRWLSAAPATAVDDYPLPLVGPDSILSRVGSR